MSNSQEIILFSLLLANKTPEQPTTEKKNSKTEQQDLQPQKWQFSNRHNHFQPANANKNMHRHCGKSFQYR